MHWLRFYILDNPVLHRELRMKATRRALWRFPLWGAAATALLWAAGCVYDALFVPLRGDLLLNVVAILALSWVVVMAVLWPGTGAAASLVRERQQRTLESVGATPLTVGQVLAGKIAAVLVPTWLALPVPLLAAALAASSRFHVETIGVHFAGWYAWMLVEGGARYWLVSLAGTFAATLLAGAAGAFTGAGHRIGPPAAAVALLLVVLLVWLVWEAHHFALEIYLNRHGWVTARAVADALLPWLAYLALAAAFFAAARWRLARHMSGEGDFPHRLPPPGP